MGKSNLDKMYSPKNVKFLYNSAKMLTKKDYDVYKCLLDSHILGSLFCPRKLVADYAGKYVISSVMCSTWIGDRSDALNNPSNVTSRANKAWMFCTRGQGVVGFAEEFSAHEDTNECDIDVSILEEPVFYDGGRALLSNNKRTTFTVKDKTKFEKIIQDFVKTGKIEEPKKEAKQENVNENITEVNNTL